MLFRSMVRMTTRTSHSASLVDLGEDGLKRGAVEVKPYVKNPRRTVAVPANAREMRFALEDRNRRLLEESEKSPFNRIEDGRGELGIVTSAVAYEYVKEVFPEYRILKLGFTNPLPVRLVREFAASVKRVVVVEELDPVLCNAVRLAGVDVTPYKTELRMMELNGSRDRKSVV